jgi:UDP-glucose 4-epimerase
MSNATQRIIILGHSGFIGCQIIKAVQQYSPDVDLVLRSSRDVDLTVMDDVDSLADEFDPEAVVIFLSGIKKQMGDTLEILERNLAMTINVSRLLQSHPVRSLVYLSSSEVYGEDIHNTNISEETPIQARTFYGIAKYTSERLLWKAISEFPQSSLAILRPPLVYGIGDETKGYGPAGFLDKLINDEELVLWGDASELREFLYVKDIARIVYEIACCNFSGVLNPVSGQSYSFLTVLDLLATMTRKKPRISYRERTKAKIDNVFPNGLFRKSFPDFHFTPLKDGLKEMIEDTEYRGTL